MQVETRYWGCARAPPLVDEKQQLCALIVQVAASFFFCFFFFVFSGKAALDCFFWETRSGCRDPANRSGKFSSKDCAEVKPRLKDSVFWSILFLTLQQINVFISERNKKQGIDVLVPAVRYIYHQSVIIKITENTLGNLITENYTWMQSEYWPLVAKSRANGLSGKNFEPIIVSGLVT